MTDVVQVALVAAIPGTIAALAGLYTAVKSATIVDKVNEYHHEVNSRMDELLRSSRDSSFAKGRAEGVESERIRFPDKGSL